MFSYVKDPNRKAIELPPMFIIISNTKRVAWLGKVNREV